MLDKYEVLIIGGGHAGCEAARVAAKLGARTLLVTMNLATIGQMSCNPAMGGIAKGQIVREIDALGGGSGLVSDASAIQFRMLNRSKGPAMWSPRTQNDRMRFAEQWRRLLEKTTGLHFWQDSVTELLLKGRQVRGVRTALGLEIRAEQVILTGGTFLGGLIHVGEKQFGGGRMGEPRSTGLGAQLRALGIEAGRMKTGTPPRLDGRSITYEQLEEQAGDIPAGKFSFSPDSKPLKEQLSCHITYTNPEVHDYLRAHFHMSPLYNGRIQSVGPRYCPSIEDKVERFAERERHQLFLEPEGWETAEVYVNGFATSLPEQVQLGALRKVQGLEQVRFFRPGYAIEYDYFLPTQLDPTLESKTVRGLFLAGQVNGTTGYEEAACQGLVAGINAQQQLQGGAAFCLSRSEAYIGVLIDDLVCKGTKEPYRMFTSRAEHRLLLRQDNADLRLGERAAELGLLDEGRRADLQKKKSDIRACLRWIEQQRTAPEEVNPYLAQRDASPIAQKTRLGELLRRPQLQLQGLIGTLPVEQQPSFSEEVLEQAEIEVKYAPYLRREAAWVEKLSELEHHTIRTNFDYDKVQSLSKEGREKLKRQRPKTLGQASRISGVSAADVSILSVYIGRG